MKRKITLSMIAALLAMVVLCASACTNDRPLSAPYLDSVKNADVFIELPALRQYGGYTCGCTCVQMIMNWLQPLDADLNLATYEQLLSATDETGTPPSNVLRFFDENGVSYRTHEKAGTSALVAALDAGHPLMLPIQAWSTADDGSFNTLDPDDTDTYLIEGHWVICVGYQKSGSDYRFYFNDPASVGYCYLECDELDARWIDMAYDGELFDHYAIEITSAPKYSPDGAFHMD